MFIFRIAIMPRPTPHQIVRNIRAALVREVAEKGIGATSVGAVAKRAGVATGTIYRHFTSKEDMLQTIYAGIKSEFHNIMVAAADEPTSEKMIRRMWLDMFAFVAAHPFDLLFIEYAGAAQVLTTAQARALDYMHSDIAGMLQSAIDDGTLADLPVSTITTLLVAPAMHMARTRAQQPTGIPDDTVRQTFDRVWLSIAA